MIKLFSKIQKGIHTLHKNLLNKQDAKKYDGIREYKQVVK